MQITDSSVFEIFDFGLIKGNTQTALEGPNKTVISEKAAKKYFGEADPIGKTIKWNGNQQFEVTGIFKDIPDNSHIKFDFLFSYQTLNRQTQNQSETSWGWYDFNTYVLLEPGTDVKALQAKWNDFLQKTRGEDWKKANRFQEFILQPMLDIHLKANLLQESQPEERGDGDSVYALSFIAFFILIIAWVNYINLSTARAMERAREVGIRKVMGSMKIQLVMQFLSESLIVNMISGLLAISFVQVTTPMFQQLTGLPLLTFDSQFWILFGGIIIIGAILAGTYPAFVLSSFKPVAVLKGKFQSSSHGQLLRKSLVVFQFATTIVLIIGVTTVYMQVKHMRSVDIGSKLDETIAIRMPLIDMSDSAYAALLKPLKNEVMRNSFVKSVTMTDAMPGIPVSEMNTSTFSAVGKQGNGQYEYYWYEVDENFVETMGMAMAAGRDFERDSEYGNVVINEEAALRFGYHNPADAVGTKITLRDWRTKEYSTIVGVVKNFYQLSPKEEHIPMVFVYNTMCKYLTAHLETTNIGEAVDDLKATWAKNFPGEPFTYFFTDDKFDQQYLADVQFGEVMATFSVLTVIIACLGLFGLSSYTILQRRKEIGIRKVLGASISQVVTLLSGGYLKIILISSILALPLAWLAIDNWLSGYTVRINMTVWMFVVPVILILATALITVSFQTIRSALVNPAKSLKEE